MVGPLRRPEISVIIIFLNAQEFIEEAIDSVFAQTEQDWELLLVDDGSSDGSSAIAQRRATEAPDRVRYLQHLGHANRGMSASRNLGVREARGAYLAFLDADDVWLPARLERHLAVMRDHDEVGMVYGPTLYWYSWTDAANYPDGPKDHLRDLGLDPGRVVPPPAALLSFLRTGGGSLPGICSLLARREVVQRVGGFEESFRGLYEDQVFLSKMCFSTPVLVVDEVLDKYRQHPNSHCHQAIETGDYHPNRPHPARRRYLEWLDGYLREQDSDTEALMAAMHEELWAYRHSWRYAVQTSRLFHRTKKALRRSLPRGTYRRLLGAYRRLRDVLARQLAAGRKS